MKSTLPQTMSRSGLYAGRYHIPCIMTSCGHATSTERLYEAAQKILADVYVCVNGDEPLIDPKIVDQVIPREGEAFFCRQSDDPDRFSLRGGRPDKY